MEYKSTIVNSVAAYAGFAVERTDVDMDSIEVTINSINNWFNKFYKNINNLRGESYV